MSWVAVNYIVRIYIHKLCIAQSYTHMSGKKTLCFSRVREPLSILSKLLPVKNQRNCAMLLRNPNNSNASGI